MKKLYDGVQRFCAAHPRFGIPNLMRVIVIGNAAVYILSMLTMYTNPAALDFLKFNLNGLLHGEIWRIGDIHLLSQRQLPADAHHQPVLLLLDRLHTGAAVGHRQVQISTTSAVCS